MGIWLDHTITIVGSQKELNKLTKRLPSDPVWGFFHKEDIKRILPTALSLSNFCKPFNATDYEMIVQDDKLTAQNISQVLQNSIVYISLKLEDDDCGEFTFINGEVCNFTYTHEDNIINELQLILDSR